jgi:hypothetical protein
MKLGFTASPKSSLFITCAQEAGLSDRIRRLRSSGREGEAALCARPYLHSPDRPRPGWADQAEMTSNFSWNLFSISRN